MENQASYMHNYCLRRIYKEGSREPAIPIHYHNYVFSPAMNIHDSVGQTP